MTSTVGAAEPARQVPSPPTERVIAVMQLLTGAHDRVHSLTEIARDLGISKATCHAILATLTTHGWAVRDGPTAGYCSGPAFAAMARPIGSRIFRPQLNGLAESTGTPVFLARRDGTNVVVIDSVGESPAGVRLEAGFRLPLTAPFGRDYIAWAGAKVQHTWIQSVEQPSPALRARIDAVLEETRNRGYVIERLSAEYTRVYSALRTLDALGEPDAITVRLAGALAELSTVDYLPDELLGDSSHPVATISAPIKDAQGTVTMSVTSAPFDILTPDTIGDIGARICITARQIEDTLAAIDGTGASQ